MRISVVARSLALFTATFVMSTSATHAQGELTKHFVFTEKTGFVAGERTMISASYSQIYPDPLGRYALIRHSDPAPRADERLAGATAGVLASSLLLYDGHTGRTKLLWRDVAAQESAAITGVSWLSGADAALVVTRERGDPVTGLMPDGRRPTSSLHLIRPGANGSAIRTVLERPGALLVDKSPALPMAIVRESGTGTDSSGQRLYHVDYWTITDRGVVGDAIPLGANAHKTSRWSADGATTYFTREIPANPGLEDPRPTEERSEWFSFNLTTGTLTPIEKPLPEVDPPITPDTNSLELVSGSLVAPPPGAVGQQPTAKSEQLAPLWVVRADGKREGHLPTATIIAPDAQVSYLLADDSAVLYVTDNAAYAVPLTSQRRPDLDAVYKLILKKQTMQNAKMLGLALIGYSQDYDDKLPPAGDLASFLGPYMGGGGQLNNPDTDRPGFTYLLNGQGLATIASPATTAMGYLAGLDGRATLWADGHVTWEDGS